MMEFIPGVIAPDERSKTCMWFAFSQGKILVVETATGPQLPTLKWLGDVGIEHEEPHFMGSLGDQLCFAVALSVDNSLPAEFALRDLRSLVLIDEPTLFMLAGRARQIVEWDRNHRFCGRCGSSTVAHHKDRAKVCQQCGHTQYPRISPCIIALITRGTDVLLARSPRFPEGVYSTIAGFVEAGETLEMAVHREIKEEVGVDVHNLQYMGSQPWPFPHSLMVGFFAEYSGGDIVLEEEEIEDARWWSVDRLPKIPPVGSISRALIDTYMDQLER